MPSDVGITVQLRSAGIPAVLGMAACVHRYIHGITGRHTVGGTLHMCRNEASEHLSINVVHYMRATQHGSVSTQQPDHTPPTTSSLHKSFNKPCCVYTCAPHERATAQRQLLLRSPCVCWDVTLRMSHGCPQPCSDNHSRCWWPGTQGTPIDFIHKRRHRVVEQTPAMQSVNTRCD